MIYTDAEGRPIPRPVPSDYPSVVEWIRAFHVWKDKITSLANNSFDRNLRIK